MRPRKASAARTAFPLPPHRAGDRGARNMAPGQRLFPLALGLVVLAVAFGAKAKASEYRVIFEADSVYHHIIVAEDGVARYLRFDRSLQSGMYLANPFDSPFLYAAYMHLGLLFRPQATRVLMVGLGGGSVQKRFWRDYPPMTIDVAELDPKVVEVAQRYFAVREDPRLRITVQDGRLFLRKTEQHYDLILLDAYFAESIPFHLTTSEFVHLAHSHLAPGGIIVSNLIGALEGPQSALFRAMYKTFATAFGGLYPFPTGFQPSRDVETLRNIILVASDQRGLTRWEILSKARQVAPRVTFREFRTYAGDYYDGEILNADVPVLTDDYAPVDTLLPIRNWTPRKP
ncbi:MAG TPA: fused MFS/spermidine synthase [bacterium]|nr:fused MFS/spermidine synthase [bacterium]